MKFDHAKLPLDEKNSEIRKGNPQARSEVTEEPARQTRADVVDAEQRDRQKEQGVQEHDAWKRRDEVWPGERGQRSEQD